MLPDIRIRHPCIGPLPDLFRLTPAHCRLPLGGCSTSTSSANTTFQIASATVPQLCLWQPAPSPEPESGLHSRARRVTPTVDRLYRTITHPQSVPARDTGVQDSVNDAHCQALRPCSAATTSCIIENRVGWPSNVPPVTVSRMLVRRPSRTIAVSLRSPHSMPPPKCASR